MKKYTSTASHKIASTFLVLAVLASLCLSSSASLHRIHAIHDGQEAAESSFIAAARTALRRDALFNSRDARTKSPRQERSRFKQSAAHLSALPPSKFKVQKALGRHLSTASGASLFYSSCCLSGQRGRAPPLPA